MRKKFIIFIIFIIFIPISIQAAESSQSARLDANQESQQASPSADLKSKLQALQQEIASRAAEMKNEVSKKLQNKAYIGTVKNKNSTSLILTVYNSQKNININEYTEYVIKTKTYKGDEGLKNIPLDAAVACLGDIDDKGTLAAKRIVRLNTPLPKLQTIVHGIITSLSNGNATVQTVHNDQFLISFDKNTNYQTGKNEGIFDDIRANKWVIVSGEATESGIILSNFVYIFPSALTGKIKTSTASSSSSGKNIK